MGGGLEALSVWVWWRKMDALGLYWKVMGQLVSKEPGCDLPPKKLLKCSELQNPWLSITAICVLTKKVVGR